MAAKARSAAASLNENEMLSTLENTATYKHPTIIDNSTFEEETEAEKKLLRKIDMSLLPTIWLVYLLSYMVSRSTHHCPLIDRDADKAYRTDPTLGMPE